MPSKKIIPLFLFFLSITSCVDDLDFTQFEDYSAAPEFSVALTSFKILPFQFFNSSGIQESEITDVTNFRIFDRSYVKDKLVKLDFNIEIKNELDRDFTIIIELLDINDSRTHRFQQIKINANNLDFKFLEVIEVNSNLNVKNTSKVSVTVKMDDTITPLDPYSTTEFELKSSLKLYFDTDA
ncbi:MAG: hypothetical protein ABJH82_02515 [Polaribacter sp.]|uniref:hypothetical protein n=1 Tax=Polaribacter sp. TaxID=1920175 RepID=UPI0032650B9B